MNAGGVPTHPPPLPVYNPPVAYTAPTHLVVVGTRTDPTAAALLGFFFGPLGLLYSTVPGAGIMFGVSVVVGLLTFGLGLFLLWPVTAVVGCQRRKSTNRRLALTGRRARVPHPGGLPTAADPPARLVPGPARAGHHPVWDDASWTGHTY